MCQSLFSPLSGYMVTAVTVTIAYKRDRPLSVFPLKLMRLN